MRRTSLGEGGCHQREVGEERGYCRRTGEVEAHHLEGEGGCRQWEAEGEQEGRQRGFGATG